MGHSRRKDYVSNVPFESEGDVLDLQSIVVPSRRIGLPSETNGLSGGKGQNGREEGDRQTRKTWRGRDTKLR